MNLRQTHTFVELELSPVAYDEVFHKMNAAGYQHAFESGEGSHIIDMHGIAITRDNTAAPPDSGAFDQYVNAIVEAGKPYGVDGINAHTRRALRQVWDQSTNIEGRKGSPS